MTDHLWLWLIAAILVLLAIGLWALVREAQEDSEEPTEVEIPDDSPWGDR